jgi:hypothetical protein
LSIVEREVRDSDILDEWIDVLFETPTVIARRRLQRNVVRIESVEGATSPSFAELAKRSLLRRGERRICVLARENHQVDLLLNLLEELHRSARGIQGRSDNECFAPGFAQFSGELGERDCASMSFVSVECCQQRECLFSVLRDRDLRVESPATLENGPLEFGSRNLDRWLYTYLAHRTCLRWANGPRCSNTRGPSFI